MGNSKSCCTHTNDFGSQQRRLEANSTYVHKICLHTLQDPKQTLKQPSNGETSTNFDTCKASFTDKQNLVIFDIWTKHALFGKDIQAQKCKNVYYDHSSVVVIKIDLDSYKIDDNKQTVNGFIKQLDAIKNLEWASGVDSMGNKIENKPIFLLVNEFSSRKQDEREWNFRLKKQVNQSSQRVQKEQQFATLKQALRDYCVRNSWQRLIFSSQITKDTVKNEFLFSGIKTLNNAKNDNVKTFLNQIHKYLLTLGTQPQELGVESEFIVKETNPEELEKMIELYRKEAANGSTKVSIFGSKNARESMIDLRSYRNDDAMKQILQNNI